MSKAVNPYGDGKAAERPEQILKWLEEVIVFVWEAKKNYLTIQHSTRRCHWKIGGSREEGFNA